MAEPSTARRRWLVRGLKWSLTAAVLYFVAVRARELWGKTDGAQFEWHPAWLVPAALAYATGWLPSVWFGWRMMARMDARIRFVDAARAYYAGHLGKYVPGKALALVIRGKLAADRGGRFGAGVLAAAVETLLSMAAGCAVGLALLPAAIDEAEPGVAGGGLSAIHGFAWAAAHPWLSAAAVTAAVSAGLPVLTAVVRRLTARFAPDAGGADGRRAALNLPLIAAGLAAGAVGWVFHGTSLWCTVRAVGGDAGVADLPACVGAAGLATAAGFAVLFAPGGAGVREAVLIELLAARPSVGPGPAVAAALLLRAVWLATELLTAAALYYIPAATGAKMDDSGTP